MRRAGIGAAALLSLLTACTGTITTSSHWSASWEKTFSVTVSYEAGELDSIVVNVNGCLLLPLAPGESSAVATVHLFDFDPPGVYLAIATEADGMLWEETLAFDVEEGDRLLLAITSLSVAEGKPAVTCTLEHAP